MEQLALVAAMVVFAYAFGMVWYHALGRPSTDWLRTMAYPLVGIIIGEGLWANYLPAGPAVSGAHVVVALFASFLAVSLDVILESGKAPFLFRRIQHLAMNGGGRMPTIKLQWKPSDKSQARQGH